MTLKKEKRQMNENIWLHYFNNELHKRSIISELERNKMSLKIDSLKLPGKEEYRKRV